MKFLDKFNTKANNAVIEKENSANKVVKAYYAGLAGLSAMAVASSPLFATGTGLTTIFNKVSNSLKDVYGQIFGISTVVAVTFVAICLIIRMVSKNQRSVEEATSWAKRVVLTWFILNLLGYFVAYGKDLVTGGEVTNW